MTTTPPQCRWCHEPLNPSAASSQHSCSKRCRQAHWRFARLRRERIHATHALRLAYADPPYPGTARKYYATDPTFTGEIDHDTLIRQLAAFDGWALSTSAAALPQILTLARIIAPTVRVAAWFRGPRPTTSRYPLNAWEPVLFGRARRTVSDAQPNDALIHHARPRATDPHKCTGAKPAAFAFWLFDVLGAMPGDSLIDLYPGAGTIGRAWTIFSASSPDRDDAHAPPPSAGAGHDTRARA